jgi:acyl-CoA thioesterase
VTDAPGPAPTVLPPIEISMPEPGHAVGTIVVDERHHNPYGLVHGGVVFTLVDTVMGAATTGVMDPGCTCATIEIHLRYLRPVSDGPVRCDVHVLRSGRRVVHLEGKVRDGDGRLLASATGSYAVIPPVAS